MLLTDTPRGYLADSFTGKDSSKADKPPRTREHRSSHSSRSDRPSTRDGSGKDGAAKALHRHSSHRPRPDGERESEQSSPRTPPRRRDTADSAQGSHSSRSRRERTPQQQAEHDRRKEERRLAREKEREHDNAKSNSPVTEANGKEAESPVAERPHKASRRPSSTRNGAEGSAAPSKKYFSGESVLESKFGGPLAADAPAVPKEKDSGANSRRSRDIAKPPPAELKRSNTSRSRVLRQSTDQSIGKSQKETVKDKGQTREGSNSPAPGSDRASAADDKKRRDDEKHRKYRLEKREKEVKEEKKKSSGVIKGIFKKLFS